MKRMKKYDKESILNQYETSGKIIYQATLNGDYKANNREAKKLIKIFKIFEQDRELAWACISKMFKSENVVVRTEAAAYCLALNMNTDMAQEVLIQIRDNRENGIFGLNAEMTLDVWNEQGYLDIYQKK